MSDRCSTFGCVNPARSRGLCVRCYFDASDVGLVGRKGLPTHRERFWAAVDRTGPGGCWSWAAGKVGGGGYGQFALWPRLLRAHRVAYELLIGPIPDGLVLDHLCRNHACVNPAHLEPVTDKVNVLRGVGPAAVNSVKTHCPHGHILAGENLYEHPSNKQRVCLECRRRNQMTSHYRQKSKKLGRSVGPGIPRLYTCADCGTQGQASPAGGTLPSRCPTCQRVREAARKRARRCA